jgi:hypothetical protein
VAVKHDLLVDNKTGPWNRTRHRANEGEVLLLDNRCGGCRTLIEGLLDLEQTRPALFQEMNDTRCSTAEALLTNAKAGGSYGAGI